MSLSIVNLLILFFSITSRHNWLLCMDIYFEHRPEVKVKKHTKLVVLIKLTSSNCLFFIYIETITVEDEACISAMDTMMRSPPSRMDMRIK
ncbi:hypothetical protein Droror1_Dr00027088, partial [Drosera rotundifolia]